MLGKVTSQLPSRKCQRGQWRHINGLEIADPQCLTPGSIDYILGADLYPALISDGLHKGQPDEPIAQNTVFRWALTGLAGPTDATSALTAAHLSTADIAIAQELQMFW